MVLAILVGGALLGSNASARAGRITELYERVAFSTTTYLDLEKDAHAVFDRRTNTAWQDSGRVIGRGRYALPSDLSSSIPDPQSLHLTVEIGLSHFPGKPPKPNVPRELVIWSGDQSSPQSFSATGRPRRVLLLFFLQALVDVDREYRFPGQPVLWARRAAELQDSPLPQRIRLDFLPALPPSPRFPTHVSQVWLRMIVESYYPGSRDSKSTAISELDLDERHPTFARIPGDRAQWRVIPTLAF